MTSAKLLILLLILVAGIAGHTYKEVTGHPVTTLVEESNNDSAKH